MEEKKRKEQEERREKKNQCAAVLQHSTMRNLSNMIQYISYTIRDRYDNSLHPFTSAMESFRCLGFAWLGLDSTVASPCLALPWFTSVHAHRGCTVMCVCVCLHLHKRSTTAPLCCSSSSPTRFPTCACCLPSRHKVLNCNAWTSAVCVRWGHASRGVSPLSLLSLSPPPCHCTAHFT